MSKTITLGCSALALVLATGSTARAEDARRFEVQLSPGTTMETIIPSIVEAGREELAAACEQTPGGAVRILHPLASDDHVDVSCADILGGENIGQTSEALSTEPGGERTSEARQKLTPIGGILCGLAGLIATTAQNKVCSDWRGQNDQYCNVGTFGSGVAWIWACALAF